MVEKSITGIVTWLKNWFYDADQIDGKISTINSSLNNKVNVNQGDGNANMNVVTDASGSITVENKPSIPSASSTTPLADVSGGAVGTGTTWARADHKHPLSSAYATSGHNHSGVYAPVSHTQASSTITDSNTYSNIGNSAQTQESINSAINTKLGQLASLDFLNIVDTLPSPSESTMGKLYVIEEDGEVNIYYTKHYDQSPNYRMIEMDANILDSLTVTWSMIDGKPSTFTPSSHTHSTGDVSDATAHSNIGSSANATQSTINTNIDTALGNKISKSSTSGFVKNDGSIDTNTYSLSNHNHSGVYANASHTHGTTSINLTTNEVNNYVTLDSDDDTQEDVNLDVDTHLTTLYSSKGAKTDDIDWSYNSNGFVNGIKLHDKTSSGDDATGTITFHLKS